MVAWCGWLRVNASDSEKNKGFLVLFFKKELLP